MAALQLLVTTSPPDIEPLNVGLNRIDQWSGCLANEPVSEVILKNLDVITRDFDILSQYDELSSGVLMRIVLTKIPAAVFESYRQWKGGYPNTTTEILLTLLMCCDPDSYLFID